MYVFPVLQYGGLFMFCGYVVFDTQMIIEKASMGDKDVLAHTLGLFMGVCLHCGGLACADDLLTVFMLFLSLLLCADLMSIFVRILIALLQNKKGGKSPRNSRRD